MPDQTKPFQIETNALKYATGAVLTQTDMNSEWHPIAFLSKTFTETEWDYSVYDWELVIIWDLTEWRHYIQGTSHVTTVYLDHKKLMYFWSTQKLSWRQAQWSLLLSEYDIKLHHMPRIKMMQADALLRRSDHCPKDDHNNKDIVLLPDDLFVNLLGLELQDWILKATYLGFDVFDALEKLLDRELSNLANDLDDWKVENLENGKAIFYKEKNYIPQDVDLQQDIVKMYHDHEMAGHPGELETYNVVKEQYWWPRLRTFVKNYVKGCAICQQFKTDHHPFHPAYIPGTERAQTTRPFANCSMDMITDLPMVNGLDSLLVMVDQGLMKRVILLPWSKMITAEQVATLLLDNLYKRFRLPNKIILDQGPQFVSQSFRELLKLLGIKSALSMAYHPQTDGTTEWVNQEIKAYLSIYFSLHLEDWPSTIPI